jgi:hypothetical protein
MKILLSFLTLALSFPAFAAPNPEALKAALEKQSSCSLSVRFDDENLYLGFGSYRRGTEEPRKPIPGHLKVVPVSGAPEFSLATTDAAIDTIRDGDSLFVLTYSGIEEWSLAQRARIGKYPTYLTPNEMRYREHPQSFARYGDLAVIAHGRLGLSFFNLKTKRIVNQFRLARNQLPLESMATGIAVSGKYAYVVLDNFSLVPQGKPAFRGFVIVDLEKQAVVAALDGMDPGADAVLADGKKVLVSFGGSTIWKYDEKELASSRLPEPEYRLWRYPFPGHPTGLASMDDKYYYTCFLKKPEKGGNFQAVPLALDRRVLLLD